MLQYNITHNRMMKRRPRPGDESMPRFTPRMSHNFRVKKLQGGHLNNTTTEDVDNINAHNMDDERDHNKGMVNVKFVSILVDEQPCTRHALYKQDESGLVDATQHLQRFTYRLGKKKKM